MNRLHNIEPWSMNRLHIGLLAPGWHKNERIQPPVNCTCSLVPIIHWNIQLGSGFATPSEYHTAGYPTNQEDALFGPVGGGGAPYGPYINHSLHGNTVGEGPDRLQLITVKWILTWKPVIKHRHMRHIDLMMHTFYWLHGVIARRLPKNMVAKDDMHF